MKRALELVFGSVVVYLLVVACGSQKTLHGTEPTAGGNGGAIGTDSDSAAAGASNDPTPEASAAEDADACAACPVCQECDTCETCADGVQNQGETGIDCGGGCKPCPDASQCKRGPLNCGGDCAPCESGSGCLFNSDCLGQLCDHSVPTSLGEGWGLCKEPSCTDGVRNGTESGTDCGGGTCAKCAENGGCYWSSDCMSGVCSGGTLYPAPRLGFCAT